LTCATASGKPLLLPAFAFHLREKSPTWQASAKGIAFVFTCHYRDRRKQKQRERGERGERVEGVKARSARRKVNKIYIFILFYKIMVEPLLSGIVLGLVPVTIAGLFVTAYLQYRRGDLANF
jgi:cytochrome b6-f complex subunit 5